jgi:hypothetical protein
VSDDVSVELDWNGPFVSARAREGGVTGLKLATEHLLEAANRTVPIEEGTLLRSGVAQADDSDGARPRGAVSYDTVYAVYQHERLENRHAPGRRAKWLELATHEEADTLNTLIATALRRALE